MTLSDESVQRILKKEFVTGWVNTENDSAAGGSFAHDPSDGAGICIRGNGRANLQILALTPDGRIFHAIAGYVSPADLKAELAWALETFDMLKRSDDLAAAMVEERARDYQASGPAPTIDMHMPRGTDEPFRRHIERGMTRDTRFVETHPLLPIAEFRTSMLGGGGAAFFGSSSGDRPGETIGNVDPRTRKHLDMTREQQRALAEGNKRRSRAAPRKRSERWRPGTEDDETTQSTGS